ncbi:MAG: hypothetical protein KAJ03_02360, partial [Gammaproteobacteria bacterium]|nr:hypothetical protein [Gammaproteobacteria bacterium]
QRDTLQTQCEDMQSEMEAESKINNASLKPSCKVLQQDQDDEMACMAEEVVGLKMELKRAHQRTYESVVNEGNLKEEINTLKDSAETQGRHMQQVDAACKVAEERVMAQRAIIDKMKKDNDVYICPSAHGCTKTHCPDKSPHKHNRDCDIVCKIASSGCVKVNSCKECATMREEIINRDAVILQYESRAEDREEIITSLAKEIKGMRCVEVTAPTTGTYTIMFSGKAGEMKKTAQQRRCKYYKHCVYATSSSNVCDNGGGKYCGVWRHHEAKQ